MIKIKEVIIVEGQHDIDKMSKYFIADYIKTEGSSLPQVVIDEINFYKNQGREFIIITDPDFPGTQIRNKLLEIIPNSKQAFVRKENARTAKKVGPVTWRWLRATAPAWL